MISGPARTAGFLALGGVCNNSLTKEPGRLIITHKRAMMAIPYSNSTHDGLTTHMTVIHTMGTPHHHEQPDS